MQTALPQEWVSHDKKVRPYVWSHRVVSLGETALKWSLLYMLWSNQGYGIAESLFARTGSTFWTWVLYFVVLGTGWGVLSFPFELMSFWVERKFQLSRQTIGAWLMDKVKGLLVGGVLGGLVLCIFYLLALKLGGNWWWAGATFLVLFSILLAQLAPVILIPIFMKLEPMQASPLKERLLNLCRKHNVEVKDVYHLGLGEKTEKGNAAFVGLGRTKRIMIGDTLYKKFSEDEVEAVFAHELGHQIHNDLWKGIGMSTVFIYLSFFAGNVLLTRLFAPMDVSNPALLLYFFVILGVIQLPIGVLQSAFSRHREHEADRFALERIGVGVHLGNALERLTFQNFGMFRPNPILENLTFSHPAPWRRITRLRKATSGGSVS